VEKSLKVEKIGVKANSMKSDYCCFEDENDFRARSVLFLPCDDSSECVEFLLENFKDHDSWCELNFMDTYVGGESSLKKRLKRAWKILVGKKMYHTGIFISDPQVIRDYFEKCIEEIDKVRSEEDDS